MELAQQQLPWPLDSYLQQVWQYRAVRVAAALVLLGVGLKIYGARQSAKRRAKWAAAGKDVVVLHQFTRAPACPNISPFALKLETYLRVNSINYIVDEKEPFGPLGKCPWITINGEEIADSSAIIQTLNGRFGINMNAGYSDQTLATSRAFQAMLEDRTAWGIFLKRYVLDSMVHIWPQFPKTIRTYAPFVKFLMSRGFKKRAGEHGIGRLTAPEVLAVVERDVLATSALLGDRPFMLGDHISELDCCVFGIVCQLLYVSGPHLEFFTRSKADNLVRHCQRIQELYWQDWDLCLER